MTSQHYFNATDFCTYKNPVIDYHPVLHLCTTKTQTFALMKRGCRIVCRMYSLNEILINLGIVNLSFNFVYMPNLEEIVQFCCVQAEMLGKVVRNHQLNYMEVVCSHNAMHSFSKQGTPLKLCQINMAVLTCVQWCAVALFTVPNDKAFWCIHSLARA